MASASTSRLKVYVTQIGVRLWVVAAPNQKAALKAWDVRENLFAQGAAREVRDPAMITAALQRPGEAIAFHTLKVPAADLKPRPPAPRKPKMPAAGRLASNVVQLHEQRMARRPAPAARAAPDRSRMDAAKRALDEFRRSAARQRREMEMRRQDLEDELRAQEARLAAEERVLVQRYEREARDYEGA